MHQRYGGVAKYEAILVHYLIYVAVVIGYSGYCPTALNRPLALMIYPDVLRSR